MIIESISVTEGGKTFKRLVYPDGREFWACGWVVGSSEVYGLSDEDGLTTRLDGPYMLEGFGMDSVDYTYANFLQEIENRDLILPNS